METPAKHVPCLLLVAIAAAWLPNHVCDLLAETLTKPPAINNLSYTQDYGDLRTSDAFEQLWPWRPLKHILLNRPLRLLHAGRD